MPPPRQAPSLGQSRVLLATSYSIWHCDGRAASLLRTDQLQARLLARCGMRAHIAGDHPCSDGLTTITQRHTTKVAAVSV